MSLTTWSRVFLCFFLASGLILHSSVTVATSLLAEETLLGWKIFWEQSERVDPPIDWPKDGSFDFCPQSKAFDFRNAYWMAAFSYYAYLDPKVLKPIFEGPRGQKIKVMVPTAGPGQSSYMQSVYALGGDWHLNFFTSQPILDRSYRSTIMDVVSLLGAKLPYQSCVKQEKRKCLSGPRSFPSPKAFKEYCGERLERVLLDKERLRNVRKMVLGETLSPKLQARAVSDRFSIEEHMRSYEERKVKKIPLNFKDPDFDISCERFEYSRDLPPDVQALWLESSDQVIIAFRGTEFNNPIDWATDLATAFQLNHEYLPFWERNVHKGFQSAFEILSRWLYESIEVFLKQNEDASTKPVFLTGHSMGGAIATLVANALMERNTKESAERRLNLKALYTFGSPRVGNRDFAEYFESLRRSQGVGVYRIVNKNDLVSKTPCVDYHHLGSTIQLLSGVQGNFPAPEVQVLANPRSEGFRYCAYGSRLMESLLQFEKLSQEHSLLSYYSVLVQTRREMRGAMKSQAKDYIQRFGALGEQENPYEFPQNCSWKRLYRSEAPAYLQLNYQHIPFEIEPES